MSKLLALCFIFLISISLFASNAEAKRFGGGRSFGVQRSIATPSRSTSQGQPAFQNPQKNASTNRWLGPAMGFLAGGLLASLFMGHGLGSGILSWLMVAGVALIGWSLLRRMFQPAGASRPFSAAYSSSQSTDNHTTTAQPLYSVSEQSSPVGFNTDEFLRVAKAQFIRLQAAYDSKNLADIREFTAPEVFAEIQLQLQERGDAENYTEVVTLNSEILNTETDARGNIASVRFTGSIRESRDAQAEPMDEVWHFRKETNETAWKVAGIQQS